MPVVKHDGANLFYQVEGKGPPLLLIMGLGYPSDMWWRMLLLGCSHPGGADVVIDGEAIALLRSRWAMTPDEAAEAAIPFIYAPGTPRADIDADLAVWAAHPTGPVGYAAQLTDTITWRGSLDRLPGLAIPTLLVHGDLDRLVPIENSRRIAAVLPNARLEILAGASHIFATDQPERTRAVVESFLVRHQ